jgi:hypothetical protein
MPRPTARGQRILGRKTFRALVISIGVGLALVSPVIPAAAASAFAESLQSGGTVIVVGVAALAVLMVLMAVLYQGYLKA